MKLSVEGLQLAILAVLPGANTSLRYVSLNEVFDLVVFTGTHIVTYNDKVSVSYPYKTDFKAAVNAVDINSVLRGVRDSEVEITVDDNNMYISADTFQAQFSLASTVSALLDIVDKFDLDHKTFVSLPDDFLVGIRACLFSVSKQASSRVLTCISIDGSIINSSDDLRISDYTMKTGFDEKPFLLPSSTCQDLLKYNVLTYCLDGTWIHFRTDKDTIFSCQVVFDAYPNTDPLFDVHGPSVDLPSEVKEAAKHVSSMTESVDEGMEVITITLKPGIIIVSGKKARGELQRKIAYPDYNGPEISFSSHPVFITDILGKSTKVTVGERVALFESGVFRHVIALRV